MMDKLAQANMGEVVLAELAKTKSKDKQVLEFANTMSDAPVFSIAVTLAPVAKYTTFESLFRYG